MVTVTHLGVPCRSRQEADVFFTTILGMPRTRSFSVSSEVSSSIFRLPGEVEVLVYDNGRVQVEAFVTLHAAASGYTHIGLEVEDLCTTFDVCKQYGVVCFTVPRGEKLLYFVRDPAGNLYELTEKKP